jgi:hypothetical protein
MAIPYVLVTSCVVIATAAQFHAQVDDEFLSNDPAVMQESSSYKGSLGALTDRVMLSQPEDATMPEEELLQKIADLPDEEKIIASSMVKRSAFELSTALAPLLGEGPARIAFGLGIFGMGFSSVIILMLINGFAVCEIMNKPLGGTTHVVGCLIAGLTGAMWPFFWSGDSQVYLAIIASSFGMMLLPIAYITFMMMMNSKKLLKDDRPEGGSRIVWNLLMGFSVAGAIVAAGSAIQSKLTDPTAGPIVITILVVFVLAVAAGFLEHSQKSDDSRP